MSATVNRDIDCECGGLHRGGWYRRRPFLQQAVRTAGLLVGVREHAPLRKTAVGEAPEVGGRAISQNSGLPVGVRNGRSGTADMRAVLYPSRRRPKPLHGTYQAVRGSAT